MYIMNNYLLLTEIRLDTFIPGKKTPQVTLEEIVVNPAHVVMMRQDEYLKQNILDFNKWPEELDQRVTLTKIFMNLGGSHTSSSITVLGDAKIIAQKLQKSDII